MPATSDLVIEPFDPHTATDAQLRARYALIAQIEAEQDPETPVDPYDVWVKGYLQEVSWQKNRRWAVWDRSTGDMIGSAYLGLSYEETNRHVAGCDLQVAAPYRRQGLGTRLLAALAPVAEEDGRTVLGAGTLQGHVAEAFLAAMGFEQKMVERRSRLLVGNVDSEMLDRWIADGETKSSDYTMLVFEDRVPEEYVERFVDLLHTMNDAPRDDLDMEDEVMTVEQFLEREEKRLASGHKLRCITVRHDPSGQLAAFTTISWHPGVPQVVWQWGTAVRREHRGHGIGRWVKAAMLKKLRAERPEVEFVDTWNAGTNKWMLAINIDLGFFPYLHYTDWQAPVAAVKKAAGV